MIPLFGAFARPFQSAERNFAKTESMAPVAAFAIIAAALIMNLSRCEYLPVADRALLNGIGVELIHHAAVWDAELSDVLADAIGMSALALVWFGRLRVQVGRSRSVWASAC